MVRPHVVGALVVSAFILIACLPTPLGFGAMGRNAAPLATVGTFPVTPAQMQTAYGESHLISIGDNGAGYSVAVVDAYSAVESTPKLISDFAAFTAAYALPTVTLNIYYVGFNGGNYNTSNYNSAWAVEIALDAEWAHASAPGATIDVVFTPFPTTSGLSAALNYTVNTVKPSSVSLSWDFPFPEMEFGTEAFSWFNTSLSNAYHNGISLFDSTGDCGAYDGFFWPTLGFPAMSPYVTAVGGTTLSVSPNGSYLSEYGWNGSGYWVCQNQGGSGGGWSVWSKPGYQNALPSRNRGIPDVSANAGTFVPVIFNSGITVYVGGTSLSTPMWAGFVAVIDSYIGQSIGNINPIVYAIYNNSAWYHQSFHQVTLGFNGYNCTPGWNPVTGLGTPIVGGLAVVINTDIL